MQSSADRRERLYTAAIAEFGGALERLARAYERDPASREDLLQEIQLGLWRSLASFDGRCSMRTWVYRVAHNVATSHVLRPRGRTPTLLGLDEAGPVTGTADQHAQLNRQRTLEALYALIYRLRPVDRQVMLMYLEEIDAATIGEVTGLTASNVATRIHRLKQVLKRQFAGEEQRP